MMVDMKSGSSSIRSSNLEKFLSFSFPHSGGGAATCHFPPSLSPLLDESSSYASVARVCLGLSQYASSGCCATCDVAGGCSSIPLISSSSAAGDSAAAHVEASYLWNETLVQRQVSVAIQSLTACVTTHRLDSCRIVAIKCLALIARSAFIRARSSDNNHPLTVTSGSASHIIKAMEDECAVDAPQTLCNVALGSDDVSDVVSAAAFWSLGLLLCCGTASNTDDDPLSKYIQQVAFFNNNNTDNSFIMDFQRMHHVAIGIDFNIRILTNVIVKRLRQLLHRASSLQPQRLQIKTLPFLTCCIQQFASKALTNNIVPGMISLSAYAKRWFTVDAILLLEDFVQTMLLPHMLSSTYAPLAVASSISLLRLLSSANTVSNNDSSSWIVLGCSAACNVLLQKLEYRQQLMVLESKTTLIAMIIVATQVLPWDQQISILLRLLSHMSYLPSIDFYNDDETTTSAASDNNALLFTATNSSCSSTRIGLLTECIVQMMIGCCLSRQTQALTIGTTMLASHSVIVSSFKERKGFYDGVLHNNNNNNTMTKQRGIHFAEEITLSFTNCLFQIIAGNYIAVLNSSKKGVSSNLRQNNNNNNSQELVSCSIILLNSFASCLSWRFAYDSYDTNNNDHATTAKLGCDAVGHSYLDLLEQCLYITGLILDHRLLLTSKRPQQYSSYTKIIANVDLIVKIRQLFHKNYQLLVEEGIPCETVRIRFISLFGNYLATTATATTNTNEQHQQHYYDYAQTILQFVGSDVDSLLLLILQQKNNNKNVKRSRGAHQLKLAKFIAMIELIASSACDKLSVGGSGGGSCSEIVRLSIDALQLVISKENGSLDEQQLYNVRSAASRIKNKFERSATNNNLSSGVADAVPLWVFAVSTNNEDDNQSIVSGASGVDTYNNNNNINNDNMDDTDPIVYFRNAAELRCFLFWKFAQHTVWSRVSKVFASIENEMNNSYSTAFDEHDANIAVVPSTIIGGDADVVRKNNLSRNTKERRTICLAVGEQPSPSSLSSIGASLWETKTGTYPFMGWTNSITTLTGASDPIVAMLSYNTQQSSFLQRNEASGNKPYLIVTVRVFNVMAVPINHGLHFDLSVCQLAADRVSSHNHDHSNFALSNNWVDPEEDETFSRTTRVPLTYCCATYNGEIKPYDSITWVVEIDVNCPGDIELHTNITFREVPSEKAHQRFQQVDGGSGTNNADNTTASDAVNRNGDCDNFDDDSSATSFGCVSSIEEEEDKDSDEGEVIDVSLACEPVVVQSIVRLLPCSLVFYTGKGDTNVFKLLWENMSDSSSLSSRIQLKRNTPALGKDRSATKNFTNGPAAQLLAKRGCLTITAASSGIMSSTKQAWAFMDWSEHRIMCRMLLEAKSENCASTITTEANSVAFLEIKCDDIILLMSIMGSQESRSRFVSDLTDGFWLPH